MVREVVDDDADSDFLPKKTFIDRIIGWIGDLLQSVNIIVIATFAVCLFAFVVSADQLYQYLPSLVTDSYQAVAVKLASKVPPLPAPAPNQTQILKQIGQYNLAWYYITNANGGTEPATRPYAPSYEGMDQVASRPVSWKSEHYYDAVAAVSGKRFLHIGFAANSLLPGLADSNLLLSMPARSGYLALTALGSLLVLLFVLASTVSGPLKQLAHACSSLLLSRDAYSHITRSGLNISFFSASEVKKLAIGLKEVRRQFDGQFFARLRKEAELEEQRHSNQLTQQNLAKDYEEKIAVTQQSLSEMHARESEEEIIREINQGISALKSAPQVYRWVLDRLNDKYPTSIVHAAFFTLNGKQTIFDASLGLDDSTLELLKEVDHSALLEELLALGSYMHLGADDMGAFGLGDFAQRISSKSAVYFPLSSQGRNLAMLAVFFAFEGAMVLDRIRILRKVAGLTARYLYQITLYLEELEAARTDPLTGLNNRKYLYEIAPQLFERAAADPENGQFSFVLVDGDNFKQVNDTLGHQVGDEVLKELAATMRKCVRTSMQGTRPKDHVIRFGGEEFLVVLPKTPAVYGKLVAERIRAAVEAKPHWPGGLAHWTVSVGVATYPGDGTEMDKLLMEADKALYYVKHELGRNKVCPASEVPKSFKWAKSYAKIAGELGVFEPGDLLQVFMNSQKTGTLTIKSTNNRDFWMLFNNGKPLQSRTGKLKGNDAIIELLTTFEAGNFKFQEQGVSDLPASSLLDDSFNIAGSLPKCLLDAALAKDKLDVARSVIADENAILRPVRKEEFESRWEVVKQLPDPPSEREIELTLRIAKLIDGFKSLNVIFKSEDEVATAHLWSAAAFLVQHGLAKQVQANSEIPTLKN